MSLAASTGPGTSGGPERGHVMMRYKQGVYWLMLVFGVIAGGIASSQTDAGAPARALVIDPGRFEKMADEPFEPGVRTLGGRAPEQTGPRIDMRQPGDKKVFKRDEPVAVDIAFLPANDGIEPDMETLKVVVRKGWFGKDITEMVRPYVEGTALRMPEVDFSGYTGDFVFLIDIEDRKRRGSRLWVGVKIVF